MALLVHKTVTLTATGTNLATLLGIKPLRGPDDVPFRSVSFQADDGNSGAVFIGDENVTSSDWGWRIPIPTANVPDPPIQIDGVSRSGVLRLSDVFAVGTANDKLHVLLLLW